MSSNTRFMPVSPQAVWDALADPDGYGHWVVGSKHVRDVEGEWPAPGSRFHHTLGLGPFEISDHTESLEAEPPRRLKLHARGGPFGTASVTLEMTPKDGGTAVRITENPDGPFWPLALVPPLQLIALLRNDASLKRLEELALRHAAGAED